MRILILFFAIALLLLLAAGNGYAQSPPGYQLFWHTFQTSGVLLGDGYNLVGIIEPFGPATLTGGDLQLVGSFAHPPCAPQEPVIVISCVAGSVHLGWATHPANAGYEIYRGLVPYQDHTPPAQIATVQTPPWPDPSPTSCGDSTNNYFYQVRALCFGGHANSEVVAQFDFALTPGS